MSTLHKIFVVLQAVFSIAFAMLFISFAAQTADWKSLAEEYRGLYRASDTHQRNLIASHAAEGAAALDAREAILQQNADLERRLQGEMRRVNELAADKADLGSEKARLEASNVMLLGSVQVAQNGWEVERTQRKGLEQRNMELEKRNIDLDERVNELSAQVLVLVQEKRQYEQENNLLRSENERIAVAHGRAPSGSPEVAVGPGMRGVHAETAATRDLIRGRITEIEGKYATVSVGSADGVTKDMVFVIYRGPDFVGELTISEVEPEMAAGRITHSVAVPQINDLVADSAGFGLRS